jgi:hypothetical protein
MRYIPLFEQTPPPDWLVRAENAKAEVENCAKLGRSERNELIDKKAKIWGDLKPWLLDLSYSKCWFSEARECFENWEVEHFRPKKKALDAEGKERDGYWWLGFEWINYRICGRRLNAKKGTYFPIINSPDEENEGTPFPVNNFPADENHRDQVEDELPLLLDPCCEEDCELLSFNELGEAVAMSGVAGWDLKRVQFSRDRYMLNFEGLVRERRLVWETCDTMVTEIMNLMKELADHPSAKKVTKIEEKKRQLAAMANEDKEFSSVALAFFIKNENEWVKRLAARQTKQKPRGKNSQTFSQSLARIT